MVIASSALISCSNSFSTAAADTVAPDWRRPALRLLDSAAYFCSLLGTTIVLLRFSLASLGATIIPPRLTLAPLKPTFIAVKLVLKAGCFALDYDGFLPCL